MIIGGGAMANGLTPRRTYAIVSAVSLVLLYLFFFWDSVPPLPERFRAGYYPIESTPQSVETLVETTPKRHEQCVDPYSRPGYLYVDTENNDYNQTRWIPYDSNFLDAPDPESAKYPYDAEANGEIWFHRDSKPENKYLDHSFTPTQWMNAAIEEARNRNNGHDKNKSLSWLDGRVVLFISDSVDRYNIQWFCNEFKARGADKKAKFGEGAKSHSIAKCVVPSLNLTMLHWHLAGMTTYLPSWWWDMSNIKSVPFEERWDKVWRDQFDLLPSISGKGPDLVIWQSSVWDRKNWLGVAKEHYGEKSPMASYGRPLVWEEIRFYAARAKKLIRFLQEKLGKDTPMMLRTITLDQKEMQKDVQCYDMDRISRAIGEKYGLEVFEWGQIIKGHAMLYRDSLHPGHGASNWLWSTMVLEYLARAVGAGTKGGARKEREPYYDGWKACHDELVPLR